MPTAKRVRKSKATDAHDRVCYVLAYSYAPRANDDATKSIVTVVDAVVGAVAEGLNERKSDKAAAAKQKEEAAAAEAPAAEAPAEEAPAAEAIEEAPEAVTNNEAEAEEHAQPH